jgi:hypothetical protein
VHFSRDCPYDYPRTPPASHWRAVHGGTHPRRAAYFSRECPYKIREPAAEWLQCRASRASPDRRVALDRRVAGPRGVEAGDLVAGVRRACARDASPLARIQSSLYEGFLCGTKTTVRNGRRPSWRAVAELGGCERRAEVGEAAEEGVAAT